MNPSVASFGTRFRVGIFTIIALVVVVILTVYVNDRPFWWRPCELVHILHWLGCLRFMQRSVEAEV